MPSIDHRCEVRVSERFDASPEDMWQLVRAFGDLEAPGGLVERVSVHGHGQGAVRTLHLAGRRWLRQHVDSIDDAAHRMHFETIEQESLPFEALETTVRVLDAEAGRARVEFTCRFQPLIEREHAEAIVRGILRIGLTSLERVLEQGS